MNHEYLDKMNEDFSVGKGPREVGKSTYAGSGDIN